MTSPEHRWQALDRATLRRRQWPGEDEGAVFNCASGDLHLLNQTALDVLEYLSDNPCTVGELAARFSIDVAALEALARSLDSLGLIRPVRL
jgi:PqqD family protein of HPr-rel-A system